MIHPKPKPIRKPGVRVMKDGREICAKTTLGMLIYNQRIDDMWQRDRATCWLCGRWLSRTEATFDHRDGRGGGKRDDRIVNNGVAHYFGNMAKGSIRYDRYMSLPLETRIKNCRGGQ